MNAWRQLKFLLLPKHVCLEDRPELRVEAIDDTVEEHFVVVAVHHRGHLVLWDAPGEAVHHLCLHLLGGACGSHA